MKITAKKKVLVTGATGFVGSNLVRRLINQNYEVHVLKRRNSNIWRIKDIASKLSAYNVNILNKGQLLKILQKIKPNIIFHLANLGLYGGIDPSIDDSIKINALGTINLIESANTIDYECFINTGSSAEYGNKCKTMRETDRCEPLTNYAIAKLIGTQYAQSYSKRSNKPLTTLRIFSPFGPYDHPNRLIPLAILTTLKGERFILNNPYDFRDYIFIEDVVDAYLLCIKHSQKLSGEIFNIGSGKQTNIGDLIELLKAKIGLKNDIFLENIPTTKKQPRVWQADITKAQKLLQWHPQYDIYNGITKTVDWFKHNRKFYGC